MIREGTAGDLAQLRALVARAADAPYDLSRVLEQKTLGAGVEGSPELRVCEEGGQLLGFSVQCGKYLRLIAVDRDHRRRGIGSALLGTARIIGAEPGNYFTPGVVDTDTATLEFLASHGFRQTATTWNLVATTENDAGASNALKRAKSQDRGPFLSFVEQHFGAIWRFESERAFENDPPTAFWIEDVGFVVHEANNRGLGTFGPTGVVPSHRGRGHGRELLLTSLADLRRLGYSRATIPWTDAVDFYRKSCGAEPAHRFITFSK